MKRIIVFIVLVCNSFIFGQLTRIAVIADPEINGSAAAAQLDSTVTKLNRDSVLTCTFIVGSLTKNGSEKQAALIKSIADKFAGKIILLPGKNDLRDANGLFTFNEFTDSKFIIEQGDNVFIGINPSIPLSNLTHYTIEDIDWLTSVLDTVRFKKDIYFFTPCGFDSDIDNWKSLLLAFKNRIPKLIIDGSAEKPVFRNLMGYKIFDTQNFIEEKSGNPRLAIIDVSKDSVMISDGSNKILAAFDKNIVIEKEPIDTAKAAAANGKILIQTELNATMITSTIFWNGKIYSSDKSGLISCIDTTGKFYWDYDTYGDIYGQPVIADRMYAIATLQGDIITLSAISGEQIQSIGFDATITSGLAVTDYNGTRELMIPKVTKSQSAIIFGTADGRVLCYDLETLQKYWENGDAKKMISSKPVVVKNKILYTSRDGYLYCIDAKEGILIWRWKEKADTDLSDSGILCDGNNVFISSSDGILYSINLLLGRMNWKAEKLNALSNIGLSSDSKTAYVESSDNKFFLINANTGKVSKEIKFNEGFFESPDFPFNDGEKIFFNSKGSVYSIDKNYKTDKILFAGDSPAHPLIKISGNKYLLSNLDGRIIIFTPGQN